MKPDEYKRKRSAQYQKKHKGAKGKNEGEDSSKPGKAGKSSSHPGKGAAVPHSAPTQVHFRQKEELTNSSATDSEDEDGETVKSSTRKAYRKREIVSNWSKYDLPVTSAEDSPSVPKGQDFNKVLELAGSAIAHFRFKEEQSWEEDKVGLQGDANQPLLSIDCNQLVSALQCLPLYAQLRLDTDIFTHEQVLEMDLSAKKQRETIMGCIPDVKLHHDQLTLTSHKPDSGKNDMYGTDAFQKTAVHCGNLVSLHPAQDLNKDRTLNSGCSILTNTEECSTTVEYTTHKASNKEKDSLKITAALPAAAGDSKSFTVENIDHHLQPGMDDAGGAKNTERTFQHSSDFTDDVLDALISMDTEPIHVAVPSESKGSQFSESAELEDWLDSVLT